MADIHYARKTQTSVTVFIHCGDEYLMVRRSLSKEIDPGCLNGIGGRLELGENFLTAAIRETKEETGQDLVPRQFRLTAVVKSENDSLEDWVMCFFTAEVSDKFTSAGDQLDDEELVWIHKDDLFDSEYKLADDLNYCFKEMVTDNKLLFITFSRDGDRKIAHADVGALA